MPTGAFYICDWCRQKALQWMIHRDLADFNPFAAMLGVPDSYDIPETESYSVTLVWSWTDSETHHVRYPLTGRYARVMVTKK